MNEVTRPFLLSSGFRQALLLTGVFLFNFMSRIIPAPFLMNIEKEFQVSHAQAGRLFLFISIGFGLSLILSGFVAQWLNHRRTIILSAIGVGLALTLISISDSFFQLKIMMFFMAMACGFYVPSGISTLTSVLPYAQWGKGLGIHEMAPNSSFILAPFIAASVQGLVTWRPVFGFLGAGSIIMGFLFLVLGRGGKFSGEAPKPGLVMALFKRKEFWILVILFTMAISITFGSYSMLPLYLVSEHNFNQAWANQLISLSRIPCLIVALAAGIIIDRIGPQKTILVALTSAGLFTVIIGLANGLVLQGAVFLQPLLAVSYFPAGFTAISRCFPTQVRNLAVSFIIPIAVFLGTGLFPAALGWLGDLGLFSTGFLLQGICVLLALYSFHFLSFREIKLCEE